jgi:hypothetical protein
MKSDLTKEDKIRIQKIGTTRIENICKQYNVNYSNLSAQTKNILGGCLVEGIILSSELNLKVIKS